MDKERKLIRQGGVPIGWVEGSYAIMDIDFFGCAAGRELTRAGIPISWRTDIADHLKQESEKKKNAGKRVHVYQLNSGAAPEKKFVTYGRLCELYGGAHRPDYHLVFDGRLEFSDLNELYELLGVGPLPDGFTGRRLSMSDVVELVEEEGVPLYYVDPEEYILIEWKE